MGVAADRGPSVRRGRRPEDLARAELPQVFPVLGDRLRLVEALRLGQHEARHAQVPREAAEQSRHVGAAWPAQHQHRQSARDLRVGAGRCAEPAARIGPFAGEIAREPQAPALARHERVGGAGAAEHRAAARPPGTRAGTPGPTHRSSARDRWTRPSASSVTDSPGSRSMPVSCQGGRFAGSQWNAWPATSPGGSAASQGSSVARNSASVAGRASARASRRRSARAARREAMASWCAMSRTCPKDSSRLRPGLPVGG